MDVALDSVRRVLGRDPDPDHVAVAFRSERHLRVHGERLPGFAPLSGFFAAADGWVRTHANYPWHEAALKRALGTDDIAAAIDRLPAQTVEDRVYAAGGLAVRVRARGELELPRQLVRWEAGAPAPPRPERRLRVLDLTRVIAGPVATRMLGALSADVLRLDPPHLPELELSRYDGLLGKRSALLDLADPRAAALLDGADVLVHGYRPGALDRFGLTRPGLVTVALSAWGETPGWAGRRGFDSLVQAASGIALEYGEPGVLPCQLLDHATGYLMAAAALEGVARQRAEGGSPVARLSLAATAARVLDGPRVRDHDPDPAPYLQQLGDVTAVAPPGGRWTAPPAPYGGDAPVWR